MTGTKPEHKAVVNGLYSHFKDDGKARYKVIAIAFHSETKEPLVIYTDSEGLTHARPRGMFEDGRYTRV
jgi:hypothetical protein